MMTTYFPSILLLPLPPPSSSLSSSIEAALSVNLTTIFMSKMEGLPPTSDIKMIDIWLVLCQMVPFVEVVLLTAMEYHRKDDNPQERGKTALHMNMMYNDDDSKEKYCQRCWIPDLKFVGRFIFGYYQYSMLT